MRRPFVPAHPLHRGRARPRGCCSPTWRGFGVPSAFSLFSSPFSFLSFARCPRPSVCPHKETYSDGQTRLTVLEESLYHHLALLHPRPPRFFSFVHFVFVFFLLHLT